MERVECIDLTTAAYRRAPEIARGTTRLLLDLGMAPAAEIGLPNGRRADLMAIDARGAVTIVEIKSCRQDWRTDSKWREYPPYCDFFYVAVDADFPQAILPADEGLIVADRFEGAVLRPARSRPLPPARRRALHLAFARIVALRLAALAEAGQPLSASHSSTR